MKIIRLDLLPPWGQALAMGACGKGNGEGDPALTTDAWKAGNSEGVPKMATNALRDDNKSSDVQ
jgi:hypothetical protein